MTVADPQLIADALMAFQASDRGVIGAPGGQKAVRLVEKAGQTCVLKVVAVGHTTDDTLTRARREVELLAEIDSANVVKVKSGLVTIGDPVRGAAWLEEYLDGEDLGPLLGSRQWSWSEAQRMGIDVSNGLSEGHSRNVIHRDLSANNVRRLSDGTYKVLDFGFARHTLRSQVTFHGQPGTPGFLSPEHLNGYSGGPATMSDVFQVGNLIYCALTGSLPYPYTGDDADYIARLRTAKIADPRVRWAWYGASVDFTKTETVIAAGSASAAWALSAKIKNPALSTAVGVSAGLISSWAGTAAGLGKCISIKYTWALLAAPSPYGTIPWIAKCYA